MKRPRINTLFFATIAAIGLGTIGFNTIGLAQFGAPDFSRSDKLFSTPAGKAFVEAYNALRANYIGDPQPEKLMRGALAGMVGSLNDEFTYYQAPDNAQTFNQDMKGEFFGIGVSISPAASDGTGVLIEVVFRGSPASAAGIQPGDMILSVDGKDVTHMDLNAAVRLIRGPKGSTVKLKVQRGGIALNIPVQRDKINLVNVSTTILPNQIGYLAISDFANQKLSEQMMVALAELKTKNIKGLVLDLRNNPGGLVDQVQQVTDLFLKTGDIFIVRDRNKKVRVEYAAHPQAQDYLGPLVVLVNGSSASASEIMTAALKENGRAKIVGEKTFGKGVANVPTQLSDGGQLMIPFEEWLTPKRNSIYKLGVTPDVSLLDTRYPKLLAFEGVNAKPGSQIEVKLNGKTLKLTADAKGRFQYQDQAPRVRSSDRQGSALVDLKTDAQLQKALTLLPH